MEVAGTVPMVNDPSLPPGWKRLVTQRSGGGSAGKWDIYILGLGKRFRSKPELERFLVENNITDINPEDIDFTVHGKNNPKSPKKSPTKNPTPAKKNVTKKDVAKKFVAKKTISKKKPSAKKSLEETRLSGKPSSETVYVRFNFKPPKRKRADSELSIDLADLEAHPYQPCTPVKKIRLGGESLKGQKVLEKKQKANFPKSKEVEKGKQKKVKKIGDKIRQTTTKKNLKKDKSSPNKSATSTPVKKTPIDKYSPKKSATSTPVKKSTIGKSSPKKSSTSTPVKTNPMGKSSPKKSATSTPVKETTIDKSSPKKSAPSTPVKTIIVGKSSPKKSTVASPKKKAEKVKNSKKSGKPNVDKNEKMNSKKMNKASGKLGSKKTKGPQEGKKETKNKEKPQKVNKRKSTASSPKENIIAAFAKKNKIAAPNSVVQDPCSTPEKVLVGSLAKPGSPAKEVKSIIPISKMNLSSPLVKPSSNLEKRQDVQRSSVAKSKAPKPHIGKSSQAKKSPKMKKKENMSKLDNKQKSVKDFFKKLTP